MATIILGNGGNLSVSDDNSDGDTIILGNGANDVVSAASSQYDTIILGNGANDTVSADYSQYDTIILGNGTNDTVSAMVRTRLQALARCTITSCWLRPCLQTSAPCRAI